MSPNDRYLLTLVLSWEIVRICMLDNNISASIGIPEKGSELINIDWYGQSILYRFRIYWN